MISDGDRLQVEDDAYARYVAAFALAAEIRATWEAEEKPLIVTYSNGVQTESPLLRLLRNAERDCARLAREIPRPAGRPGRKPAAVLSPSPTSKLRSLPPPLEAKGRKAQVLRDFAE